MGRSIAGEERFEALFRDTYPTLVRALFLASGDHEAAKDAAQEAFVQAHRHWRRVQEYDDPAACVRRVATNRLSNLRRGRRRQDAVARRLAIEPTAAQPSGDPGLAEAIASLPPQQRTAVALFYGMDLSVAQVAEAMNLATGTVRSHLHDARRALSTRIGAHDEP